MVAVTLLILVVVMVLAGVVFGVVSMLGGHDPGLVVAMPDGRAAPLPNDRSLTENDLKTVRFDVGWRGYRMAQVDRVLRRTAYDVGYKDEMIAVLEAEVLALRDGRLDDADLLRAARESAANPGSAPAEPRPAPAGMLPSRAASTPPPRTTPTTPPATTTTPATTSDLTTGEPRTSSEPEPVADPASGTPVDSDAADGSPVGAPPGARDAVTDRAEPVGEARTRTSRV